MSQERIQHSLVQGTPEWHAFRLEHDGASEAAAMLGLSKYTSRSELLRQKATGIAPEVDDAKQRLFDAGHRAEEAARPMAEKILGEELYPSTHSYGTLSASLDGLTMDGETAFEHKLWAADLAASVAKNELPDEYQPQCQQIMLVTGAKSVLFMVSDGTPEKCEYTRVEPHGKWMERIQTGWAMFQQDLDHYQYVEVLPPATAAVTKDLPALSIQVRGEISLIDNLNVFGAELTKFIAAVPANPSTDQEFADCEAAVKTLEKAQNALEAAEAGALAQVASVEEMTRTVALYAAQARNCRLMLTKLVKDRKESIRVEIVQGGKDALAAHIALLNRRLGRAYMPVIAADFAGVIKGKKTVASLRDACDSELARCKIEANSIADRIQVNVNLYRDMDTDYGFLFSDLATIILKENDDFATLVKMRISEHAAAEAKRIEAEAEKARERIRAEEQAKLVAEAAAETKRLRAIEEAEYAKFLREQQDRERRERDEADKAKEQAAAQVGGSQPVDARTEPASGAYTAQSSGQSPAVPAPAAAPYGRPRDDQLIAAIALAFDVNADTAKRWLVEAFERKAV